MKIQWGFVKKKEQVVLFRQDTFDPTFVHCLYLADGPMVLFCHVKTLTQHNTAIPVEKYITMKTCSIKYRNSFGAHFTMCVCFEYIIF